MKDYEMLQICNNENMKIGNNENMSLGVDKHKLVKMLSIVNKICGFNEENQKWQGMKILTPNQILNRLPISLAHLNAGNNSEKLKNESRQLLHSLYKSKKLTKNIYKCMIDII